jgi:hypothetical protein
MFLRPLRFLHVPPGLPVPQVEYHCTRLQRITDEFEEIQKEPLLVTFRFYPTDCLEGAKKVH